MSRIASMAPETVASVETLRGMISIFGIVLHACMFYMLIGTPNIAFWSSFSVQSGSQIIFTSILRWIHMFYMPQFFLLAGYFSYRTYHMRGSWDLVKKRLVRLGLPLLAIQVSPFIFYVLMSLFFHNAGLHSQQYWSAVFDKLKFVGAYWFLEDLLILYFANLILLKLVRWLLPEKTYLKCKQWVIHCFATPWSLITVTLVAGLAMFFTHWWMTPVDLNIVPNLAELITYELFFVMGWLLYSETRLLALMQRYGLHLIAITLFIVFPLYLIISSVWQSHPSMRLLSADLLYAAGSWIMMLGLLGVCLRYLCRHHFITRYLADASYWVYLVQIPILQSCFYVFKQMHINLWLSFGLSCLVTLGICLITYQFFVRNRRWIYFLDSQYQKKPKNT